MSRLAVKAIPPDQPARDADDLRTLPARLARIKEVLQQEYCRRHNHPWVVAFSGGKDSTLLLQLTWEMMAELPPAKRHRPLIVLGNDTLVESPLVMRHLRTSLTHVATAAGSCKMPIETRITTPAVDQTFWVNVIGRGYIPPTRNFRWCTDRMKIRPTSRILEQFVREHGGAILLVGTRRSESQTRGRRMARRKVSATRLNPHSSVTGCRMFAPLADLNDDDVWMVLMQRRPPWGGTHRDLISLYRQAAGGECPLVISTDDAPSCGSSSPRFGCWTCTVVAKDRSLRGLIDSGHEDAGHLTHLYDFREWLIQLREEDSNRLPVRRDGNPRNRSDGSKVYGPFTLQVRRVILKQLLTLQDKLDTKLITEAEIDSIEDVWWRDKIKEEGRLALQRSFAPA